MTWPPGRSKDGGVDEVPLPGVPGRLFLCGKHAIGPDVEAVVRAVGADRVICLTEMYEVEDRYPEYAAWLRADERATHHPIPDFHAPEVEEFAALVEGVHDRVVAGSTVVLHCAGGYGRTGTVAAGLLVRLGLALDDALTAVRTARPMAGPEVGAQTEVLRAYEARRVGASRSSSTGPCASWSRTTTASTASDCTYWRGRWCPSVRW